MTALAYTGVHVGTVSRVCIVAHEFAHCNNKGRMVSAGAKNDMFLGFTWLLLKCAGIEAKN